MSQTLARLRLDTRNSSGTLSMTYTMNSPAAQVAGILADASTTSPATGTYRYYSHDNLGSTRRLRASDKSSLGAYEYTPYGQAYATSGVALGSLAGAFTGKAWDDISQLYYFPYRYYSPDGARWVTRDPLGMVDGPNVYAYVGGNPANRDDALGLFTVQGPCMGEKGRIRRQVKRACRTWVGAIKDPKLSKCIAEKCKNGTLTCDDKCPKPKDGGYCNRWRVKVPYTDECGKVRIKVLVTVSSPYVCVNNARNWKGAHIY